jgi:nucleoside 2-deoxyribosyltransferase
MLGRVYFASGWFNPAAAEEENRVKTKLRELGFDVFSPKDEVVLNPNATDEERNAVFAQNVKEITACDIFFGITDYKDMGTIWECGCVCGINYQTARKRKIVYYAETLPEGAAFNVMLQKSADVVITKFEDLDNLPKYLETGKKYEGQVQ